MSGKLNHIFTTRNILRYLLWWIVESSLANLLALSLPTKIFALGEIQNAKSTTHKSLDFKKIILSEVINLNKFKFAAGGARAARETERRIWAELSVGEETDRERLEDKKEGEAQGQSGGFLDLWRRRRQRERETREEKKEAGGDEGKYTILFRKGNFGKYENTFYYTILFRIILIKYIYYMYIVAI